LRPLGWVFLGVVIVVVLDWVAWVVAGAVGFWIGLLRGNWLALLIPPALACVLLGSALMIAVGVCLLPYFGPLAQGAEGGFRGLIRGDHGP
jgi:hypothetical protein